ncbi:hypothetical protein IC575_005647 [Cucumis melo]
MLKILFFIMSCGMWIRLESPFLSAFLDFCVGFFFRKILPSSLKQPLQVLLSKFYLSVIGCVRGLMCLSARFCSPRSDPQSFAIDMRIPYVGKLVPRKSLLFWWSHFLSFIHYFVSEKYYCLGCVVKICFWLLRFIPVYAEKIRVYVIVLIVIEEKKLKVCLFFLVSQIY